MTEFALMADDYNKKVRYLRGAKTDGLEIVSRGNTTFGDVLQPKPDTPDLANVLSSSIEVTVSENPEIRVFQVRFPETHLHGLRLIKALASARKRSIRTAQSLSAIMADWNMPDEARSKDPNRDYDKKLAKGHTKAFPNFWPDFVWGDREDFMAAVTTPEIEDVRNYFGLIGKRLMTETEAADLRDRTEDEVRSRTYTLNYVQIQGSDLGEEYIKQIAEIDFRAAVKTRDVISRPYSDREIRTETTNPNVVRVISQEGGVVKASFDKSYVKYDMTGEKAVEIERFEQDLTEKAITPVIAWLIDRITGQRYYLDQGLGLRRGVLNNHARAERRLGLLLATSFSDRVRDKLPEEMSYHPGGRRQGIFEAQIAMLVYMEERMLLQGEVFKAFERRAGFDQADKRRRQFDFERALLSLSLKAKSAKSMVRRTIGTANLYIYGGLLATVVGFGDGLVFQTQQNNNLVRDVPIPEVSREDLETAKRLNLPLLEYLKANLDAGVRVVELPAALESREALATEIQYWERRNLQTELRAKLDEDAALRFSWPLNRGTRDWTLFGGGLLALAGGIGKKIKDNWI